MRLFHSISGLFALGAIVAPFAFGNGMVIDNSIVRRTGNLVPLKTRDISLEREQVDIALRHEYADVVVEYILQNRGGPRTVDYAFPVDVQPREEPFEEEIQRSIPKFIIRDNGEALPILRRTEEAIALPDDVISSDGRLLRARRIWWLTKVTFAEAERKVLRVSYSVRTFGTDFAFERASRDSTLRPRTFR